MEQMDCSSENLDPPASNGEQMDQTESTEIQDTQEASVEQIEDVPAKVRKPKTKKRVKTLRGVKIDRFRFLLKQGYRFELAFHGACKRAQFEQVATSVMMAAIARRSREDPWLYQQVCVEEKRNYSFMFRRAFHALIEQGESVKDALVLARRETDTRTVLETQIGMCDPKTFEGKIRIIICSTSHPEQGITSEEFRLLLAEMKKNYAKINDIRYTPYLVECRLVPGTGYILAICADAITVRWVRLTLKWMTLWPGASLCMVHEKKFLESSIMTVSIPDGIARKTDAILNQLKVQNPHLEVDKWSVLTTEDLTKQKLNKLTMLVPLKDCKMLETLNLTLNYNQHQLKLVAPEDRTKIGKRAIFRGVIYAPDLSTEELFKTIEKENEGIAVTEQWRQLHRNKYQISFYVDSASAEAIRAADHQINVQSKQIKLLCQSRLSEI